MLDLPSDFSYRMLPEAASGAPDASNMVQLKDVCFGYEEGELLLRHLNLEIPKGFFLGIAGPSGCGKSSLIKVICRLEQAQGEVFLDGREIDSLSRKDISRLVAMVPQTPFLIAGTLRENICYGLDREVSDEEMEEVVRRACLAEFVNGLPERFDFLVSEAGGGPVGRAEAEDCHCQGVFKGCKGFDFGRGHLGA